MNINKDTSKDNNLKSTIFASITWVLFCCVLFMLFLKKGYVGFESNDDIFMNMISSGAYGSVDAHNIYNNIILGWFYAVMYRLSGGHNWNTLLQLAVILASYISFGVWNICRNKILKGYTTSLLLLALTWESMICRINYSKTGAIAMAVGFVLLISSLDTDKWKLLSYRLLRILAYVFIIGGGLFRKNTTMVCIPFLIVLGAYLVWAVCKNNVTSDNNSGINIVGVITSGFSKTIIRTLPIIGVCIVVLLTWVVDYVAYNANPEWKYFTQYNEARTELLDFGMPIIYSNPEIYDSIGLNETDVKTFRKWRFADEEVFSLDKLKALVAYRDKYTEKSSFSENVKVSYANASHLKLLPLLYMSIVLTLLVYIGTAISSKGRYLLWQTLIFGGFIAELLVMLNSGRIVERAFLLPVFAAYMSLLTFGDDSSKGVNSEFCKEAAAERDIAFIYGATSRTFGAVVLIGLVVITGYVSGIYKAGSAFKETVYDKTAAEAIWSYADSNKDNLYLMDISSVSDILYCSYSPFDHLSEITHGNIALMGGWQVPAPAITAIAEPYCDSHNLFKELALRDNVFWISEMAPEYDDFCDYMLEHYGKEPKVDDRIGSYYVISFK